MHGDGEGIIGTGISVAAVEEDDDDDGHQGSHPDHPHNHCCHTQSHYHGHRLPPMPAGGSLGAVGAFVPAVADGPTREMIIAVVLGVRIWRALLECVETGGHPRSCCYHAIQVGPDPGTFVAAADGEALNAQAAVAAVAVAVAASGTPSRLGKSHRNDL
jgi:hypothetical protein